MEGSRGRAIRLQNRMRVLRLIYQRGSVTKQQIAEALGMSLPTVLQNIKELTGEGLIRPLGPLKSTGGRKAMALAPVENARLSVGVAVWKHHIELLLMDLAGKVVQIKRHPLMYCNQPDYYRKLAQALSAFIEGSGIAPQALLGAGFSIPGIVDRDVITDSHVLGIQNVPTAAFSEFTGLPCAFTNDANAAALAEMHAGDSLDTFAYLSLNDCVGGSIIIDGRMYLGENRRAGEFGHMKHMPFGRACYCGMEGCVDAFCSAPVLGQHTGGSLDQFFSLLAAGDRALGVVWSRYLDSLAICVNNLRMALDCPIVLGGEVGGYLEDYLEDIRLRAGQINTFSRDGSYVYPCICRRDASVMGAALLQTDRFFTAGQLL